MPRRSAVLLLLLAAAVGCLAAGRQLSVSAALRPSVPRPSNRTATAASANPTAAIVNGELLSGVCSSH